MVKLPNMQPSSDSRKKICYVITKGNWGGAAQYVYTLATQISKEKYEPIVIMGKKGTLTEKLAEDGIKIYSLENLKRDISLQDEIKSSWELLKIIRKEKPHVLHLNSPKAAGFGAVAGRLAGVKRIIYTVHGFAFNEDRGLGFKILTSFFSWITVLLCHQIIVINEKEKHQTLFMPFVSDRKIILIRNGIKPINFPKRPIVREALLSRVTSLSQIEKRKLIKLMWFGSIAELHKNKGLEYAIQALSKINQPFVFFVIGEGEEREHLEKLVHKLGLTDKIFFIGFLEKAYLYLKAFDIFLLTSTKEGLPYTLLEASLAELPIIASRVGGIPDIIGNGENGVLVAPGKITEITRAIEFLLENQEKQKMLGEKIKEKILKDFSVDEMIEKTLQLYS
jgi:glycosyltransferase involved in cell wall biosynthesis